MQSYCELSLSATLALLNMLQLFLNIAVKVLIYLNYFGTRICRRYISICMHLLCLRFGMLCVPGAAF